jgi:hypothetical protein
MKTTKGGKVMNPTDAFRKEQRKKELKRVSARPTLSVSPLPATPAGFRCGRPIRSVTARVTPVVV